VTTADDSHQVGRGRSGHRLSAGAAWRCVTPGGEKTDFMRSAALYANRSPPRGKAEPRRTDL